MLLLDKGHVGVFFINSRKLQGSFCPKILLSYAMVSPAVVCINVNVSFQDEQTVV